MVTIFFEVMANRKQTGHVRALNSHMITALVSMFLTGTALIALGLIFSLRTIELGAELGVSTDLLINVCIAVIIVGVLLILVGTLQAFGLMAIIKKFLKKIVSGEIPLGIERTQGIQQTGIQAQPTTAPSGQSTGLGRPLTIVRPQLQETEVPQRAAQPKSTSTKKPSAPAPRSQLKTAPQTPSKKEESSDEEIKVDITLEEGLQSIVDRYNTEKVKKAFKGWENTLMMDFSDLGTAYLFTINGDQGIELAEGRDDEAAVQVVIDSNIFLQMMTKQINPIKAYSSGKLEVQGQMKNLLKLRKLMF